MEYVISEEELKKLIGELLWSGKYDNMKIKTLVNKFLKSKQPVELVAEGKFDLIELYWHLPDNPAITKSSIKDYTKQFIKIYIQKVRESK